MDIISFNEASKANERIQRINANPDSNSGIVTVPKKIEAGETVTVPAGRVAMLPNVQVDGEVVVEAGGEIFIPAGATLSKVAELEGDQTIDGTKTFLKSPIVPTPTDGTQAVNKEYADLKVALESFIGTNQSKTQNGYQKLPGGLIIQWGRSSNVPNGGSLAVTLPLTFPTAFYSLAFAMSLARGPSGPMSGVIDSTSRFTVYSNVNTPLPVTWIALGY